MSFEKYIDLGGHAGWGPEATLIHSSHMEKVASSCHTPSELLSKIENLKERKEGVYVLLNAMGAYEYWGVNRNGDAFPEWSLLSERPPADVQKLIDTKVKAHLPNFCAPSCDRYGHRTFVTDAHVYNLHENKDPLKALGDVVASAYNKHMHRVELIVFVYESRAPDTVRAIREGLPVPWSMGAKLPFDVCSICFNIARHRGEYCEHLRNEMNRTYDDGRKVFAYNWFPRFFDISRVRVPADMSAWSLRKVAGVSEGSLRSVRAPEVIVSPTTELSKVAYVVGAKTGSMVKSVDSSDTKSMGSAPIDPTLLRFVRDQVAADMSDCEEIVDPQLSASLKEEGLKKVLTALALAGIVLKPKELERARRITNGEKVPDQLDLDSPPIRLITVIRSRVPSRSLRDPDFSLRRRGNDLRKKATFVCDGDDYGRYLALLKESAVDIVKVAERPAIKLALDPDAIGNMLFKTGTSTERSTQSWLPFLTAVGTDWRAESLGVAPTVDEAV